MVRSGGSGGVGTTTAVAATAVHAVRSAEVLLVSAAALAMPTGIPLDEAP
jgi:anion-transporting  ArsA/GET3 family ATPase